MIWQDFHIRSLIGKSFWVAQWYHRFIFCHFCSLNTCTIDLVRTSSFRSAFVVFFRGGGGGGINNKNHLSLAEAGRWAELNNTFQHSTLVWMLILLFFLKSKLSKWNRLIESSLSYSHEYKEFFTFLYLLDFCRSMTG